jgi:hypothetical protein
MKFALLLITMTFSLTTFAGWKADSRKLLKQYKHDCKATQVSIDSIVPNQLIKGHVNGLPSEALDKFKVVFYVKTNVWYIHPYMYYQGQEEGYSFSNINAKGEFQVKTVKREVPSKEMAAVVVPKSYKIRAERWWLKPILGFVGGVLKYQCASTLVEGNGDF